MDVRHALLTVLAAIPLTGCPSTWGCDPNSEKFDIDEPVTAEELDAILQSYSIASWEEIDCMTVCRETYRRVRGWETGSIDSCELTLPEDADGTGQVTCKGTGYEYFCEGRRPLGHVEDGDGQCADPLGRTLAAMAYLEAASVLAFEQLAEQLLGFGAPAELIERCRIAADDERAHTRWLTMLAEQRGASVPTVTHSSAAPPLFEVAMHNAVEGCVHETFAALTAACRATRATSPALRRVFARIAADETRHGQLAWDLHVWLQSQLDDDDAAAVDAARAHALTRLPERARELASLPVELGSLADAEVLAQALSQQLVA